MPRWPITLRPDSSFAVAREGTSCQMRCVGWARLMEGSLVLAVMVMHPASSASSSLSGVEIPHLSVMGSRVACGTRLVFTGAVAAVEQRFGMAPLEDGGRVAYALTGRGPLLLVAPGWLSHLELGWAIPAERMFHEALSSGRTLVRYDRPGCGLSDPYEGPRTMALELATIRAVTKTLGATRYRPAGLVAGRCGGRTVGSGQPGDCLEAGALRRLGHR